MYNQATVNSLCAAARARMALTNVTTISDADLQEFCKQSLAALHDILSQRLRDYFITTAQITPIANQENYLIPDDFRSMLALYWTDTTSNPVGRTKLTRFTMADLESPKYVTNTTGAPKSYRICGTTLFVSPAPTTITNASLEMWYVPQFVMPTNPAAAVEAVLPVGWELWVIFDMCVAIAARMQIPEFYSMFSDERKRVEARIIAGASVRDEQPPRMGNQFERKITGLC